MSSVHAEIADDEFQETTDSHQMSTSSGSQQESRAGSAGKLDSDRATTASPSQPQVENSTESTA